jgi:hypothetical protein
MKTCGKGCVTQCFCCVWFESVRGEIGGWCFLHEDMVEMFDGCEEFACRYRKEFDWDNNPRSTPSQETTWENMQRSIR